MEALVAKPEVEIWRKPASSTFWPRIPIPINVPVYPSEFLGTPYTHKTRMNFGNIIRGQEVIGEKQKNVNGREIETGSGRGQMTSSSGSGLRGQRHV